MNYYDEIFSKVDLLIKDSKYDEALMIIEEELAISYIPRDIEKKLKEYHSYLKGMNFKEKVLSIDEIEEYLKSDKEKQLLAVDALNSKNLRDYYDLCNEYLQSDGFENAKVLLIDSLIKQEINKTYTCKKDKEKITFNPSFIKPIEISNEYQYGIKLIEDYFLHEPSKSILANQLLYKQLILYYPLTYTTDEIVDIAKEIEDYINKAFDSAK